MDSIDNPHNCFVNSYGGLGTRILQMRNEKIIYVLYVLILIFKVLESLFEYSLIDSTLVLWLKSE